MTNRAALSRVESQANPAGAAPAAVHPDLVRRIRADGNALAVMPDVDIALGCKANWPSYPLAAPRAAGDAVTRSTGDSRRFRRSPPAECAALAGIFGWTAAGVGAMTPEQIIAAICAAATREAVANRRDPS